jgi:hypothetical protein
MSDKTKNVLIHVGMLAALGALYAAQALIPQVHDNLQLYGLVTAATAWLYGKLGFAPAGSVTAAKLGNMDMTQRIAMLDRAAKHASDSDK